MVSSKDTSTRFADDLLTQWRNPAGGRDDIGTFNRWFMNSAWDDLMATDSASERLGWDIYGTLKQYNDFPDRIPHSWVREQIDRAISDYEIASASASDLHLLDLLSHRTDALKSLSAQLAMLDGGSISIGDFTDWFTNARWDDRIFSSSGLNPLMWAIDTLLLEYEIFPPEDTDEANLAKDIRREMRKW